jgi:SRSO17 transposase
MTPQRVRAAAQRLSVFHQEFAPCFGRCEAIQHSFVYARGLLAHHLRKNVESIALHFGPRDKEGEVGRREVQNLQNFLSNSPWDYHEVQRKIQKVFARELAPEAQQSPVGVVGVIDESGDEKSGTHSCGTATQWLPRRQKFAKSASSWLV